MQVIHHHGRPVAIADTDRVLLAPDIHALPDRHPTKRLIALMCFYARDTQTGALPGPYTDHDAQRYAQVCLTTTDPEQLSDDDDQAAQQLKDALEQLTAAHQAHHESQENAVTSQPIQSAESAADLSDALARPRTRAEQLQALWAMTASQRVAAMRRGELSLYACCAWAARHPDEVPRLQTGDSAGGEFEFLAQHAE